MIRRRVVITGIGIVAPTGTTAAEFWRNCVNMVCSCNPVPTFWQQHASYSSHFWASLPAESLQAAPVLRTEHYLFDKGQLAALTAASEAIRGAQISLEQSDIRRNTYALGQIDPGRTGTFVGTGAGGITSLIAAQAYHTFAPFRRAIDQMRALISPVGESGLSGLVNSLDSMVTLPARFNPFTVGMMMPSGCAAAVALKYGIRGANHTSCCACASGTVAIGNAFRAIRSGQLDCALAGGAEYLGDDYGGIFKAFDLLGVLAKGDTAALVNRPFDRERTGFLFSEGGAAILVLEELDHALAREAPIIAEIAGFAESFEAQSMFLMNTDGEAIAQAIRAALEDAGFLPESIDYINAHATGTPVNDEIESRIILDLFGKRPLVNATKSLIGHTLGACGAIEAAVTALSLQNDIVHGTANLVNPVSPLNIPRATTEAPIRRAISESFAFGGHNAVLAFNKYTE